MRVGRCNSPWCPSFSGSRSPPPPSSPSRWEASWPQWPTTARCSFTPRREGRGSVDLRVRLGRRHRLCPERLLEEAPLDALQLHQPPVLHVGRRVGRAATLHALPPPSRVAGRCICHTRPTEPSTASHCSSRIARSRRLEPRIGMAQSGATSISAELAQQLLLNGFAFHMQSVSAYAA